MKSGDIFWAKDVPTASISGEVIYKNRPVVVMSNSKALYTSGVAQVLPLTSKINKSTNIPTHVLIDDKNTRLNLPSAVLPEQICTIPQSSFLQYCGNVGEEALRLIEKSVMLQLDITH